MHLRTYGTILPKRRRALRTPPPQHRHVSSGQAAKRGERSPGYRLVLLCLAPAPWYLLPPPVPLGCDWSFPSALPRFPTSARGPKVSHGRGPPMVCCKAQAPSPLPALCCIHQGLHRVSGARQGGSRTPSVNREGSLPLHSINSLVF